MSLDQKPDSTFSSTLRNLSQAIPERWERLNQTDPQFASLENSDGATMTFEDHLFPNRFRWRMVHYRTADAEGLTILVFPEPEVIVPIFVCELTTLTGEPTRMVLDLVPIDRTTTIDSHLILEHVHARCPDLTTNPDLPAWYRKCRSGDDFYVHSDSSAQQQRMQWAVELVWQRLLLVHSRVVTYPKYAESQNQIAKYKIHQLEHNPVRNHLSCAFGESQTTQFLLHHLFQ